MAANRNDDLILSALLSTPKIRDAAAVCSISERVIYRRLADPDFKARYDAARREVYEQSATALQAHLAAAIETMAEIMNDTEAGQQTRLNAAESIVRNSLKFKECIELSDRLDDLERKYKELEERSAEF